MVAPTHCQAQPYPLIRGAHRMVTVFVSANSEMLRVGYVISELEARLFVNPKI
jgi:hypothetical protein